MRGIGGAIVAAVIWFTSFVLLQFFGPTVEVVIIIDVIDLIDVLRGF